MYSSALIKLKKIIKENSQAVSCYDDVILRHHLVLLRWLKQLNKIYRYYSFMILQIFVVMKLTSVDVLLRI